MRFPDPLIHGTLRKRYKRFLSDVALDSGDLVVAHCANPGSMLGLAEPGSEVWLSPARNPKRKLRYSWELVRVGGTLVGVNTGHPNALVEEALRAGQVGELAGYPGMRREVRYGANSRVDLLLEDGAGARCYVEVKNVHLVRRPGLAEFPDSVTQRGAKHMRELAATVRQGHRAVIFYVVQRGDCARLGIAADIDPGYAEACREALASGVEALAYVCHISRQAIVLDRPLPIEL